MKMFKSASNDNQNMELWIIVLLLKLFIGLSLSTTSQLNNSEPKFNGPVNNVSVAVGRDAVLTCVTHNLGGFKLAWIQVDTQTILTIQKHVVTVNNRISISHTEHRIWELRIREVRETDRGWYMCQINTDPMKSQMGYLAVMVPPDIDDYQTSLDQVVNEGQNVSLTCMATGLPAPIINWRREGAEMMSIQDKNKYISRNANITLWQVTRDDSGPYLCIAMNGIPPSMMKRVKIMVNFAPQISTSYDTIFADYGQHMWLECAIESRPRAISYWLKDNSIVHSDRYDKMPQQDGLKHVLRLLLPAISNDDFGEYKCVAKNSLGETEKIISVQHKNQMRTQHSHQTSERGNQLILIEEILTNGMRPKNVASSLNLMLIYMLLSILNKII